ncbi:MAG: rod shape-determining protein MreC [Pseudomonadota bacterium]
MAGFGQAGRRKRPMRRLALAIFIALSLALLIAQTAPVISNAFTPVRSLAGDVQTFGDRREQSQESDEAPGLWARLTGQADAERRIKQLENEVAELSRYRQAAIAMNERFFAYQAMLNAVDDAPIEWAQQSKTVRIVAETNGPFADTLLADAGRRSGVQVDDIAFNEMGVVGRVISVGERSSRILMVTDFNSRVPVMGERSGVRAVLYGARDRIGRLSDLPEDDGFILGERILTSGEGGVFPRGLVAGHVFGDAGDWRVRFTMRDARGGFVRLLPPPTIPEPEPLAPPTIAGPEDAAPDGATEATVEAAINPARSSAAGPE